MEKVQIPRRKNSDNNIDKIPNQKSFSLKVPLLKLSNPPKNFNIKWLCSNKSLRSWLNSPSTHTGKKKSPETWPKVNRTTLKKISSTLKRSSPTLKLSIWKTKISISTLMTCSMCTTKKTKKRISVRITTLSLWSPTNTRLYPGTFYFTKVSARTGVNQLRSPRVTQSIANIRQENQRRLRRYKEPRTCRV